MTVSRLRDEMSSEELTDWSIYFDENPLEKDGSHRLERMFANLSCQMSGRGSPEDYLLITNEYRQKLKIDG